MRFAVWMAVLVLAGCNGPSPHFSGAAVTRVAVGGSVFDVRVRGNIAESIRVNAQYAPRLGPVRGHARAAIGQVSGCAVEHVLGDASVQLGLLNCGPGAPDWGAILRYGTGRYDCIGIDSWSAGFPGDYYVEFECDPI